LFSSIGKRHYRARDGDDYGGIVEVMSSLRADDAVIIDPSDSILDGSSVQLAEPTQKEAETMRRG
jgi:hypothetical protein